MKRFATVKDGPNKGNLIRSQIAATAHKVSVLPWQERGLSYTASGYGERIPTRHMVRTIDNRWRRVYATCFSNAATLWIVENGERVIVELP
jgi:hypothetical protein